MSSFVIKNCPCLEDIYDAEFDNDGNMRKILQQQNYCIRNEKSCDKVSYCLLKQIVFFCKMDVGNKDNMLLISRYALADLILEMLEIEEVDE